MADDKTTLNSSIQAIQAHDNGGNGTERIMRLLSLLLPLAVLLGCMFIIFVIYKIAKFFWPRDNEHSRRRDRDNQMMVHDRHYHVNPVTGNS